MKKNMISKTILTGAVAMLVATGNAQQGPTADEKIAGPSGDHCAKS